MLQQVLPGRADSHGADNLRVPDHPRQRRNAGLRVKTCGRNSDTTSDQTPTAQTRALRSSRRDLRAKYDGFRSLAVIHDGRCDLVSCNGYLPKLGARQDQPPRPGFLCLRKSAFREAGMQPQGLTRKSISVPPCSFTLLFSELTIEPSFVFSAIDNFRFEIPTTPWVFPVTG